MNPTTIKIFLVEGDPTGLRTAEIDNWTGKALLIPRNKLQDAKGRPEVAKPSVYFLIGKNEEDENKPLVYVGEAGNFWTRVSQHGSEKDFWQTAIAFSSKDDNFTKVHAGYLENICYEIAQKTGRCELQNNGIPTRHSLSESDIAGQAVFLDNLRILLSSLGYTFLEPIISQSAPDPENPLFYCQGKGALATGRQTNEGFVVYKDSTATTEYSKYADKKNPGLVRKLLENGYIQVKDDKTLVFLKDYQFNSPSAASDMILGNSSNGREKWKTAEGKMLKEIYQDT